ncbi:MAG: ABC transporter ATP-binding protein [Euryarchaeota archaeon TMED248]|nr:MAG: ABC transporter ATP-binding protein [Euryarchaeota archaeon TMED248]
MSEVVLEMKDVAFRHQIPSPRLLNPFDKKLGPGIFSINLKIRQGQILGLVGPNGAGKTTLLRMLAGIFSIDKGEIIAAKSNSMKLTNISQTDLRSIVGHMPEQVRWQGKISVKSALTDIAEMRNVVHRVDGILKMVGLGDITNSSLDQLSQGMRQRLTLATALLGSPKILLLDEPFNGLDPVAIRAFEKLLVELSGKGVSIIISSHRVAGMAHLVDRLALLHQGQLLIEGTLNDIENEFELGNRIEISGTGKIPNFNQIIGDNETIIESEKAEESWSVVLRTTNNEILKKLIENGHNILTWKSKEIDIVELLCAATGQNLEEIGFGVISSSMMPYRDRGEEE